MTVHLVIFSKECDCCGGQALLKVAVADSGARDSDVVRLEPDFLLSQTMFVCEECECRYLLGDLEFDHDETTCVAEEM